MTWTPPRCHAPAVIIRCPLCDETLYESSRQASVPRVVTEVWPPGALHTCPRLPPER